MHPQYGSCYFAITQDEECRWICEAWLPWLKMELVEWIGQQLEEQ